MPIGQLIYFPVDGEIEIKYNQKKNAKYSGQINKPVESMMWKNSSKNRKFKIENRRKAEYNSLER